VVVLAAEEEEEVRSLSFSFDFLLNSSLSSLRDLPPPLVLFLGREGELSAEEVPSELFAELWLPTDKFGLLPPVLIFFIRLDLFGDEDSPLVSPEAGAGLGGAAGPFCDEAGEPGSFSLSLSFLGVFSRLFVLRVAKQKKKKS